MAVRYKRRRRRGDSHVDDWLMTYADMITLLLCFFAIFLSVSVPEKEQFAKARQKVMEQFAGPNILQGTGFIAENSMYNAMPSIVDQYDEGEVIIEDNGGLDLGQNEDKKNAGEGELENVGEGERPGGTEKEGDRIRTIEMPSAAFFASGSAVLSDEGKRLLQEILDKNLRSEEVKDYIITVEGHTDDAPIKTAQFPSNWELSTARAAAVVRFFIERGIPAQRLRASGYADSVPKAPNRDTAGKPIPENQAQNRRVIMKLEKIEKDE